MAIPPETLTAAEKWLQDVLLFLSPQVEKESVRLLVVGDDAILDFRPTKSGNAGMVPLGAKEIAGIVESSASIRQSVMDKLRLLV